jgi:hypothetical protein
MTFLSNWSHPTCLCDYYFWRSENTAELLNSMIHARVCVCICKSMFSCRKTKGSNMGMPMPFLLLLLLIVTVSASQKQRTIEARALSSLPQPSKYVHIYRNFTLKMSLKRWLKIDRCSLTYHEHAICRIFQDFSDAGSCLQVLWFNRTWMRNYLDGFMPWSAMPSLEDID